jgi:hypothetical protein
MGVPVVVIDFARSESDTSVHFAYRDGKTVLLDRKATQHSPRTGA